MADLKLTNIGKTYKGGVDVLKGINLDIKRGELIVFVGPSGCGKSTLLRMIAGLETITHGEMSIDGMLVNDVPPAMRGIAMVFQSYALYPHMTVRENMAFALKIAKKTAAQIEDAVAHAAHILKLQEYLDRLPKALSGGQRQRVAIGRAIVRDPKVFLFDEPLSNLDAALRVATRIEIAKLKEAMPDRTMVYVTHDQVEAMTLADRIVVLANRGIAQMGTPMELYQTPQNEFVAEFIGSPAMNLLPGVVIETGSKTVVELDSGARVESSITTTAVDVGKKVNVGVRPEDLSVCVDAELHCGRIDYAEALGDVTLLYFHQESDNDGITAKIPGIHLELRGQVVKITADADKVHLFHNGQSMR